MKRKWRLYLDTSVFGGCFDEAEGFARDSWRVMDAFQDGLSELCYSDSVVDELEDAPERVKAVFDAIPSEAKTKVPLTDELVELSHAYLNAGIVGPKWFDDTLHVAAATVARADAIVSWNFKHIVRLDKIKAYNAVNLMHGYGVIMILSPKEVNFDDTE